MTGGRLYQKAHVRHKLRKSRAISLHCGLGGPSVRLVIKFIYSEKGKRP